MRLKEVDSRGLVNMSATCYEKYRKQIEKPGLKLITGDVSIDVNVFHLFMKVEVVSNVSF